MDRSNALEERVSSVGERQVSSHILNYYHAKDEYEEDLRNIATLAVGLIAVVAYSTFRIINAPVQFVRGVYFKLGGHTYRKVDDKFFPHYELIAKKDNKN